MTPALRFFGPDEIAARLSYDALFPSVRQAMISYSTGDASAAAQVLYPSPGADIHVKSAVLPGAPVFTVKLAGWSQVLKAAQGSGHSGLILVCDATTCQPLAVLQDDHLISDFRTGAAGALAAEACVSGDLDTIAVVGAGTQARHQVQALAQLRPFRNVQIWARRKEAGEALARQLEAEFPKAAFRVFDSAPEAMRGASLVILATAATEPLFRAEDVQPGQTLISVGADDETKCELPPELLARADKVFTDSLVQARAYGSVARALRSGISDTEIGLRELGAAWLHSDRLRDNGHQIIVSTLTGLGVQDLAAVLVAFEWGPRSGRTLRDKKQK